jgi:two-component system, cell cycle response regulator
MTEDELIRENEELKKRLAELMAEAANNETIMKRMQARELLLLRADKLPQLLRVMVDGLRESYSSTRSASCCSIRSTRSVICWRPAATGRTTSADLVRRFADRSRAAARPAQARGSALRGRGSSPAVRGPARSEEHALVPLPRMDRSIGALCLGSRDATRFTRHHGTDFLAHLGAVAAVCLENAVNRDRLLRAGITDFLTGWHNRRYLQQRLREELSRAQRHSGTIACLMIDIDRFKGINDAYGHLAGDNALKEIAQRVEAQIRSMDTAARFGGDELAIIAARGARGRGGDPRRTHSRRNRRGAGRADGRDQAQPDRLDRRRRGAPGTHETDLKAVGDRLLADADAALYRAKALGRNRVQVGAG